MLEAVLALPTLASAGIAIAASVYTFMWRYPAHPAHPLWPRGDEVGPGQVQDGGLARDDHSRESWLHIVFKE